MVGGVAPSTTGGGSIPGEARWATMMSRSAALYRGWQVVSVSRLSSVSSSTSDASGDTTTDSVTS